jgi:hypothetical protein
VDADLWSRLSTSHSPARLIVLGAEEVIKRLASVTQGRVFTFIGTTSFNKAIAYGALWQFYQSQVGPAASQLYDRFDELLEKELARVIGGIAYRDADGDGAVEEHEQVSYRSIRLMRG